RDARGVVAQATLDVLEAADREEVVALVVIERCLLPEPLERGVGVGVDADVVGVVVEVGHASLADQPPSTGMIAPLTYEARSDARKAATSATSCGRPPRPSAAFSRIPGVCSGWAPMISVWMKPGQRALTRMPLGPYSMAATLVIPTTPCLAAV